MKRIKNASLEKMNFSFVSALTELLQGMPPRSRDILEARFGIVSGEAKTLEDIGQSYLQTRCIRAVQSGYVHSHATARGIRR